MSPRPRLMRRFGPRLASVALLLLTAVAPSARAADALPESGWKPLRIGVLPVRSYVRGAEDLFEERPGPRQLRETAGQWQRHIERTLSRLDLVRLRPSTDALKRALDRSSHREATALARERYILGVERYRALATDEAIEQLERAARLYLDAQGDVTEARELADVQMYLGLAQLERGGSHAAHMAFRQMWLLDPGRVVDRGYYPEAVERALAGALVDLAQLPDKVRIRFPASTLVPLAAQAQVEMWVTALIEAGTDDSTDAPVLALTIFDSRTRSVALDVRIPLDDDPLALDLLDRELTAWHACALESQDRQLARRVQTPRWSVDLGYTHTLFLRHDRTRQLFHSPGVGLAVAWQSTSAVHVFGEFSQMVTAPDSNHDLLSGFITSRLAAGAGLTGGSRRVRVFVQAGLELAVTFTDIRMSKDVDCKHFGADDARCSGLFRDEPPIAWLGLNFGTGLRVGLGESWYLTARTGFTSYVAPASLVRELNFPLSFTLGIGSRF
ncbi:MAG: hypothetical protein R3F39_02285 [Myxococcota bacterium]